MKGNVQLSVYSPFGKKLCELYNSACQFSGQASDLSITKTIGEIHTLSFTLPTVMEDADGALIDNFRWSYIKNENLIYVTIDDSQDVYRIKTPEDTVTGKKHGITVTCLHRSENLKSRGLTQSYDAFTANAHDHMELALAGTGWGLGTVDTFNEENIFEKKFHLTQTYVRTPSDMSFGAYAEVMGLEGAAVWDNDKGWITAVPRIVSLGKNLFNGLLELGHLDVETGAPIYVDDSLRYRSIEYIYVKPFRLHTLSISGENFAKCQFLWYDSAKTLLSVSSATLSANVPSTAAWVKILLRANDAGDVEFETSPSYLQLEVGATTAFEKYKTPYTIEVQNLGPYDVVNRSTVTRATGYNQFLHTVYETDPVDSKLSTAAVKLYKNGIVYLDNDGTGSVECDIVYSVDTAGTGTSPKEMVRSMSKESGTNALDNLKAVAELFSANLVFNGYAKTVGLVKVIGKNTNVCFRIGKNMKSIKRSKSTTDFITRLYVTGQTSEVGFIGIEDVNPLGTAFILDFEYFKDAGMLSQDQIDALDSYIATTKEISSEYRVEISELMRHQDAVNGFVGQSPFAFASVTNTSGSTITIGQRTSYKDSDDPVYGDPIYLRTALNTWQISSVVSFNPSTRVVTLSEAPLTSTDALWTKKPPAGTFGARLIEVTTKREMVDTLQAEYDDENTTEDEKTELLESIALLEADIDTLMVGTTEKTGFNSLLSSIMLETLALNTSKTIVADLDADYKAANAAFDVALGDAINDGIFPQGEYAAGQELKLYADAVKYLHEASRPKAQYTVDGSELSKVDGYELERINYGDIVYVSEHRLGIQNLEATVTTFTETPLSNTLNTFNVDNYKDSTKWMEDIVSASNTIKQKSKLYDRIVSIDPNGLINPIVLQNTLDTNNVGGTLDITGNPALDHLITDEQATVLFGYRVETPATYTTLTDIIRTAVIRARVFSGNEDITYSIPASNFSWIRTSSDPDSDAIWNADASHHGVKSITLGPTDVKHLANITCAVTIPD